MPVPVFAMSEQYARLTGCDIVRVPWPDRGFEADAVLGAVREDTTVIWLTTPNNPTGATISTPDLLRIARSAPQCLVVVDLVVRVWIAFG